MYGKVVKKSEYEIKFGAREQLINVFICCKSLKNASSLKNLPCARGQYASTAILFSLQKSINLWSTFFSLKNSKLNLVIPNNKQNNIIFLFVKFFSLIIIK